MNRTIKDATVKRYFYETHDQLRAHLQNFVDAYNFARRLKTLRGLTPYEFICKAWTSDTQLKSAAQQMRALIDILAMLARSSVADPGHRWHKKY